MNILYTRIEIANPFDRWEFFKNLGCLHGRLTANKAWELEHTYFSSMLFDLELRWSSQTDHAGIELVVGLLGYGIHLRIYDTRHWDYDNECWQRYPSDHYYEYN